MHKRNVFSLSHNKLLTFNQGQLVPIGLTEVLPGDTFKGASSAFIRVSPLVTPVMHPVHVAIHHYYCPMRLLWDDFVDFITGGPDGLDNSTYPTITTTDGFAVGSLADYLGVPTGIASLEVSALPFRMYAMIYNHFYRDQDLQTELTISTASGADSTTSTALQNACWEKDYFTTARPWPQKGPDVTIPVTGASSSIAGSPSFEASKTSLVNINSSRDLSLKTDTDGKVYLESLNGAGNKIALTAGNLSVVGSTGTISLADMREAYAIQRFEENRSHYGSRYDEYLMREYGVRSSDARLQQPEYLGGGLQTIQFSEVLQTAEGTNPVGTMRGHGVAAMRSNRFRKFFEEHGYIMSFMVVRPKAIYSDGLPRLWNRRTKEDFYQPEFAHIGDQEVLNKEVYAGASEPDGVFGYTSRYDEYRRHESSIAGEFRSTLTSWHMARMFGSEPVLNSSFVTSDPTDRVYASTSTNQLYAMVMNSLVVRRAVSKVGNAR